MSKNYKVIVNTGNAENNEVFSASQGQGDRGQTLRLKAKAGAKYQLQEVGKDKNAAPESVRVKRVGKNLHFVFEDGTQSDLIIEDYYEVMPEGYNAVVGETEQGVFYEYIPEDPDTSGLIPLLNEGGQFVSVVLGGAEVVGSGAAISALVAFNPFLAAAGLTGLGAAAATLAVDTPAPDTPLIDSVTDNLGNPNDAVQPIANGGQTNDTTPTFNGRGTPGEVVTIRDGDTLVGTTTVNPDGTWSFTAPVQAEGPHSFTASTPSGGTSAPFTFTVDTQPPTVAISSNLASLGPGQTATITFLLSEASNDFTWNPTTQAGDITVTGGTLGALTQDITNPLKYTAVFTPLANSTATGVISVAANKFSDGSANFNTIGDTLSVSVNNGTAPPPPAGLILQNDAKSVAEAGEGVVASDATGNVLTNDTGNSPSVSGVKFHLDSAATAVPTTTTSANGTSIVGQYGTLVMGADGSYKYTVNNANASVQGLRTGSQTLSDVFTYTANDGTGAKTANLVITVTGTNDTPTVTAEVADKTGTVGTALAAFSVASHFADVDSVANGETGTLSATLASGAALPSWLTFDAATGTFTGTPTAAGTTSIKVTRTDAAGASANDSFDIVVLFYFEN